MLMPDVGIAKMASLILKIENQMEDFAAPWICWDPTWPTTSIVAMAAPRLAAWMRRRKGRGMVAAELQGWKGLAVKTKKGVRREREGKWLVMVVIVRKMRGHLGKLPFLNAFLY
ncbi:hypothetical protein ACJRO7_004562 [Eucalyptus globulus]|uniref:Uncharacterized protein n=1 Tax=Eucalyptus globulus TaxID=34317 RepID=A0ABD3J1Q9_EUCGL